MRRSLSAPLAACLALALLTGCRQGAAGRDVSDTLKAVLAQAGPTPDVVECSAVPCRTEWQRAAAWVARHAKTGLDTSEAGVIRSGPRPDVSSDYGFKVTRYFTGRDQFRIELELLCANPLGCQPRPELLKDAFNRFLLTGDDVLARVPLERADVR